ncbi:MAG: hypothetical protein QXI77_02345 [Nanopusillaceae archaeon]
MIKYYEKVIKREIRGTKRFRKDSYIKIIGVSSNVYDFSIQIIEKISKKYNLNIKIDKIIYKNLTDIELEENVIFIIPLEGVFLSYLLYNVNNDEKYYFIFKKYKNLNISYKVSEYVLSKYINKIPCSIDKRYYKIIEFIYKLFEKNEKYAISLGKFLDYIEKYY